ncbi:MAG: hypothetical protein Q7K55_08535 [Candidatus Levybacteria bacterium]|nr:hypothetical protein [Candidatus Levybacteria bacterium]
MKKSNILFSLIISGLIFSLNAQLADAKLLPQAKGTTSTIKRVVNSKSISIFPKLRRDRKALNVSFSNLSFAKSVEYSLIYQTGDREEGAGGSINMQTEKNGATRELLFGTCSKNDCRYHANIKNMRLEVISDLKTGKKTIRRYRIRI